MKNEDKQYLRDGINRLIRLGRTKEYAVNKFTAYGFKKATIINYWKALSETARR